jgi:hypothetical protein
VKLLSGSRGASIGTVPCSVTGDLRLVPVRVHGAPETMLLFSSLSRCSSWGGAWVEWRRWWLRGGKYFGVGAG